MNSEYEWDDADRRRNLKKYGLDFSDIHRFGWDAAITGSSSQDGEARSDSDMVDGYLDNGLTPEELAALPPYEKVAHLTFVEIAALYDEETAINVGIATDPDTWVPTDEEMAQARPFAEVFPELAEAHRAGRIKMPPRPPVTKRSEEVILDSDIVDFFKHLDPNWQTSRLNDFLRVVIFKRHPGESP